jgi:hypothetical protein
MTASSSVCRDLKFRDVAQRKGRATLADPVRLSHLLSQQFSQPGDQFMISILHLQRDDVIALHAQREHAKDTFAIGDAIAFPQSNSRSVTDCSLHKKHRRTGVQSMRVCDDELAGKHESLGSDFAA